MKKLFAKYLTGFGIVDYVDEPGGMIGEGGTGAGGDVTDTTDQGGSGDDSSGGEDGSSADGDDSSGSGSGDGEGGSSEGEGEGDGEGNASSDGSSERLNAMSDKIDNLMALLNDGDANSDDDGSGDLTGLEHEDLVAMMADNPADFISKLTSEIEAKVTSKVSDDNANNAYNGKVEETINAYADANEDFEAMWDKGEIQAFMEDNPGHNAISAHMTMTMEAKLADATKKGEETAVNNFQTKSKNQVLNGSPGIPPEQRDAALKDPGKFGGAAAVLAQRAGIQ